MGFSRLIMASPGSPARPSNHEDNEFRIDVIVKDIDGFEPPYYCTGKVGRPRAVQPQQHFPARCLQNYCETHFFYKSNSSYKTHSFSSFSPPDPGYQMLASRSWLPDLGLASRCWLPDSGHQILATRFGIPDPSNQVLAARSWILHFGYKILAT